MGCNLLAIVGDNLSEDPPIAEARALTPKDAVDCGRCWKDVRRSVRSRSKKINVQVALAIRGFSIRGLKNRE